MEPDVLVPSWCIKEAAYKALYPSVQPTWKEMTYRGFSLSHGKQGTKPSLVYHPTMATEASKIGCVHISVSHDGDYVFGSVIVEGPTNGS